MKKIAIAFCFMPWIVFSFIALYVHYSGMMTVQAATNIFGLEWIIVSPIILSIVIMIAYREGQSSVEKENEKI